MFFFGSVAYDRYVKLWDTETGECVSRFTSRKTPYCCKFHPDEDKQHLFVAGTSDKKIICVSICKSKLGIIPTFQGICLFIICTFSGTHVLERLFRNTTVTWVQLIQSLLLMKTDALSQLQTTKVCEFGNGIFLLT